MSETLKQQNQYRRPLAVAGLALLGAAFLGGCSDTPPDYEGVGDEFVVRGIVEKTKDGEIQVDEDKIVVESESGRAGGWFESGKGQTTFTDRFIFYSGYENEETKHWYDGCGSDVEVGTVVDDDGQPMNLQDLQPGTVIEIHGRIRDSRYWQSTGKSGYCNEQPRTVFDTVQVVDGPLR